MHRILVSSVFLIFISYSVYSQIVGRISGQITDIESNVPIGYVNIYLANTTIGTISNPDGYYFIDEIPSGIFTLVFQHVGYEVRTYQLVIRRSESLTKDVQLKPVILESETIEIIAIDPEKWQDSFNIFKQEFIGETKNAFECTILNPDVLSFDSDDEQSEMVAKSDSVLKVQNLALGYDIEIILVHFRMRIQGDRVEYLIHPRYYEISSADTAMKQIWQKKRRECYLGSRRHFLASLATNRLINEDFVKHTRSFAGLQMGSGIFISPGLLQLDKINDSPFFKFKFEKAMRINYKGCLPNLSSIIQLSEDFALIDTLGNLLTPLALTIYGSWADFRIADTLPFDYKPE